MPRICLRRGDVPVTALVVNATTAKAKDAMARAAVLCHAQGTMMILQVPDEDDYRLVGFRGDPLPKDLVDSILAEVARHEIPDDHWIAVHRPDPSAQAS